MGASQGATPGLRREKELLDELAILKDALSAKASAHGHVCLDRM